MKCPKMILSSKASLRMKLRWLLILTLALRCQEWNSKRRSTISKWFKMTKNRTLQPWPLQPWTTQGLTLTTDSMLLNNYNNNRWQIQLHLQDAP
jgi:hypothetical protein